MTFTGTMANINTALNGLSFAPTANFNGAGHVADHHQRPGQHRLGGAQVGHRHGGHHRQRGQRRAGQHGAGGAEHQRRHRAGVLAGNGNQISIADVDAGAGSVQVTLTGTNGTLTLAGIAGLTFTTGDGTADATMTFTGTVANINTALNGLSFAPTANFNGAASLQITTNDQGNTGTGGAQIDTDTVAITVNAVNDAPVNTVPAAQSTNEDTALVFSTGNGNQISISDVDAGCSPVQVTLTGTNGTITLAGIAGLTLQRPATARPTPP